jgi:tetratricopeptide (TPR) repeat protein
LNIDIRSAFLYIFANTRTVERNTVSEMNEQARIEEVTKRAEELKKKTIEEESHRIDTEIDLRARELFQTIRAKEDQYFSEQLERARTEHESEIETLRIFEDDQRKRIESEIQKKSEERKQEIERRRKAAEEEDRKRLEELSRIKAEEDRRLRDLERKQKEEEEHRRREELQKRLADEQLHQEEERQERITALIHNARELFNNGNYEHARVEIAKALVNDPINQTALELESLIKEAQGINPEPIIEEPVVVPKQPKRTVKKSAGPVTSDRSHKPRPLLWGIIIGVIIIGIITIIMIRRQTIHLPVNIAVFPLTSTLGSVEETVIGSSLAEEISSRLGSSKQLNVLAYSSSYNLVHRGTDPERKVFQLGNAYLLQGTISRDNNVINAQFTLIDSTGSVLWNGHYQKPLSELSDIPTDVSNQLLTAFSIDPNDAVGISKYRKTNSNSDSYLFYLRGLELLHRQTDPSSANAYQLFLQAAQQDPKFSEALAAAANVQALRFEHGWLRGDSIILQGQHLAQAAINANPMFDGGYIALARFLAIKNDFQSSITILDSAIMLSPNNAQSHFEQAKTLFRIGKYPEAFDQFQSANTFDAANPEVLQTTASAYQLFGSNKQAMRYHEIALKFTNDSLRYLVKPFANSILGDPELRLSLNYRVIAACYRLINSNEQDFATLYHIARLRQISGDTDAVSMLSQTERTLQGILQQNPRDIDALTYLVLTLTRLGRFNEANVLAERALTLAPTDDIVYYRIAQMNSLQMYSQRERKLDEKKKAEVIKYLKSALSMNYRFDELTSADLYNMFQQQEFHSVIQQP